MSGTPYLIGSFSAAAGGSVTPQFTITTSVASGDAILVGVLCTSGTVTAVTDSQSNGYTLLQSQTTSPGCQLFIFAAYGAIALTGGTDVIGATYSTNASVQGIIAVGDNGVLQISASDVLVNASGTSTTASVATGTLGASEEHVIAFIADLAAGGVPTLGGGLTALRTVEGGTVAFITAGYNVVASNASTTPSGTITSTTWAITVATNKVAPVAVSLNIAGGVQGEVYSQTLEATGGVGPYTWSITSGALPAGLTLASGVISGTPTVNGSFTITVQASDVNSVTGSSVQTIVIAPNVVSGAPAQPLQNNLLSAADSDFEVPGFTWFASANANPPARTSQTALTGSWSLSWSSAGDGDTTILSGLIPGIKPNSPYILSGFLMPSNPRGCFIGVNWYTSGGTLISSSQNAVAIQAPQLVYQPVTAQVTSPATAGQARVSVTVQATNKGEMQHLELPYIGQATEQVLIDWVNSPFATGSMAGLSFMDVSSFVRMDQGIAITRGRVDSVAEIQPGSATFRLQSDNGLFMRANSPTLITALGGAITLQRRCQINFADELGNWRTRFDGPISAIDYSFDNTGNTSYAGITLTDVLSYLSRRDALKGWTRERIKADGPMLHWALNDVGTTGGAGLAAETSGNNGPPMRLLNSDKTLTATIAWQSTTGGVETLADAGGPAASADGSEFWVPGSNQPGSVIRGLDSGKLGPFATPSPSPYFVPKLTAGATQGLFTTNTGYMLQAQFPATPLNPGITGNDFAIECFYTMDPGITANKATNNGPFVVLSFGSSRKQSCYVLGIFYQSGTLQFGAYRYPQSPAFLNSNGIGAPFIGGFTPAPPTPSGGSQITVNSDTVNLPHHIVANIDADTAGAPLLHVFLDGVSVTDISMKADDVIDTICVGGAYGGTGAFWGNVQLVSVYPNQLSVSQIAKHCQLGEYGMWETTTDDAIAEIAAYSGLPGFWNQVSGAHAGLSLTEYQDITNQNPLTAMQLYEQAERGLLFVNSAGQLIFHTRDWRMGYPGPDLLLPPNTFDAAMQYGIVDRFMQNEAGVATQVLQTGSGAINSASQAAYGTYATNAPATPQQLPLFTWNRSAGQLGLPAFNYSTDPNLDDLAAWNANSFGDPFMIPGTLTVDLLTLDPTTGLGVSNFYALDIDNVIALSGAVPASFPNQTLAQEWFIEGIEEARSLTARTIQFFCSPTTVQRAWKPGDATYGVLGTTSRIGISQNDQQFLPADGKDVTHDAGRPYWPPSFYNSLASGALNSNPYFTGGSLAGYAGLNGTLAITSSQPAGGPTFWAAQYVNGGGTVGAILESGAPFPVVAGQQLVIGAWVYSSATGVTIAVDWQDANHNPISTGGATVTVTANTWTPVTQGSGPAPSNAAFAYPRVGPNTLSATLYAEAITVTNFVAAGPGAWSFAVVGTPLTANFFAVTAGQSQSIGIGDIFTVSPPDGNNYTVTAIDQPFGGFTNIHYSPNSPVGLKGYTVTQVVSMNNPAQNGHGFIGANDIRGLADNLNLMLKPPMCVVTSSAQAQAYNSGSLLSPDVFWDTIHVDTASGMGLIPGWPNWYVCTVPGFYDIDAALTWQSTGTATGTTQGWIVVARAAAQAIAAGTGNPRTVTNYVCPIGESSSIAQSSLASATNTPTTRLYLGLGDMVALAGEQNTGAAFNTGLLDSGSHMSILFRGYGQADDSRQFNTLINSGGTVSDNLSTKVRFTKTYVSQASFAYNTIGAPGSLPGAMVNINGFGFQGTSFTGTPPLLSTQVNYVTAYLLPWAQMESDMGPTATLLSIKLTLTNITSLYKTGATAMIGYSTRLNPVSELIKGPGDRPNLVQEGFRRGQTKTASLPVKTFGALAINAGFILLGSFNTTDARFNGSWNGGPGWLKLTFTYLK